MVDAGADDYLVKPFGPEELLARLRAALRRSVQPPDDPPVEFQPQERDQLLRITEPASGIRFVPEGVKPRMVKP